MVRSTYLFIGGLVCLSVVSRCFAEDLPFPAEVTKPTPISISLTGGHHRLRYGSRFSAYQRSLRSPRPIHPWPEQTVTVPTN